MINPETRVDYRRLINPFKGINSDILKNTILHLEAEAILNDKPWNKLVNDFVKKPSTRLLLSGAALALASSVGLCATLESKNIPLIATEVVTLIESIHLISMGIRLNGLKQFYINDETIKKNRDTLLQPVIDQDTNKIFQSLITDPVFLKFAIVPL